MHTPCAYETKNSANITYASFGINTSVKHGKKDIIYDSGNIRKYKLKIEQTVLQTIEENGVKGNFLDLEISNENTDKRNIQLKATWQNFVSIIANYASDEKSFGMENSYFDLFDIGASISLSTLDYILLNIYVNDKSINKVDINTNLSIGIDSDIAVWTVECAFSCLFIMNALREKPTVVLQELEGLVFNLKQLGSAFV